MTRLKRIFVRIGLIPALVLLGANCAALASATSPMKSPSAPTARATQLADAFWAAFHDGRYEEIDVLIEQHAQELIVAPSDPLNLAHLGWLHAWKLSERNRAAPSASIVQSASLAHRYFQEAVVLAPNEPRFAGFLASFVMAEADILKNEKQTREGYFMMQKAVAAWPEFNLFTSGYTMSSGPVNEDPFQEGLEQQWQTLEECMGHTISRTNAQLTDYMKNDTNKISGFLEPSVGFQPHPSTNEASKKRACFNTWIAPHNWEGFCLNFGDMLVRNSDEANAKLIYEASRLSKTFDSWPHRAVLERRLASLSTLKDTFQKAAPQETEMTIMFNSNFACMGCHQSKDQPRF